MNRGNRCHVKRPAGGCPSRFMAADDLLTKVSNPECVRDLKVGPSISAAHSEDPSMAEFEKLIGELGVIDLGMIQFLLWAKFRLRI